jgi:hypothetical protein
MDIGSRKQALVEETGPWTAHEPFGLRHQLELFRKR